MTTPLARKFFGKKYMWDGATYATREEAQETMDAYARDGFEVETVAEGDQHLVYTRRVAQEHSASG